MPVLQFIAWCVGHGCNLTQLHAGLNDVSNHRRHSRTMSKKHVVWNMESTWSGKCDLSSLLVHSLLCNRGEKFRQARLRRKSTDRFPLRSLNTNEDECGVKRRGAFDENEGPNAKRKRYSCSESSPNPILAVPSPSTSSQPVPVNIDISPPARMSPSPPSCRSQKKQKLSQQISIMQVFCLWFAVDLFAQEVAAAKEQQIESQQQQLCTLRTELSRSTMESTITIFLPNCLLPHR